MAYFSKKKLGVNQGGATGRPKWAHNGLPSTKSGGTNPFGTATGGSTMSNYAQPMLRSASISTPKPLSATSNTNPLPTFYEATGGFSPTASPAPLAPKTSPASATSSGGLSGVTTAANAYPNTPAVTPAVNRFVGVAKDANAYRVPVVRTPARTVPPGPAITSPLSYLDPQYFSTLAGLTYQKTSGDIGLGSQLAQMKEQYGQLMGFGRPGQSGYQPGSMQDQFQRSVASSGASQAGRGIYNSGIRQQSDIERMKNYNQAVSGVQSQYGLQRQQEITNQRAALSDYFRNAMTPERLNALQRWLALNPGATGLQSQYRQGLKSLQVPKNATKKTTGKNTSPTLKV